MGAKESLQALADAGVRASIERDYGFNSWRVNFSPAYTKPSEARRGAVFRACPDAAADAALEEAKKLWPERFAPPPPPQTTGQRTAAIMVEWNPIAGAIHFGTPSLGVLMRVVGSPESADAMRSMVAAALDQALADEREACAKVAEQAASDSIIYTQYGNPVSIAAAIRDRK